MTVKNTLKEFKQNTWDKLDETILKQYTRLTKKWEEKGHSRYSLAHMFNLSASGIITFTGNALNPTGGIPLVLLLGSDFARNLLEPYFKKDITDGVTAAPNPDLYIYKKVADVTRLPFFVSGISLMAKGGINLANYLQTQNSNTLNDALNDLSLGYTFFGTASSMYIKESDPKLLDKVPVWKQAYESLKEKVKGFLPQPTPKPAPVAVNRSLEGRVK